LQQEVLREGPASGALRLEAEAVRTTASRKKAEAEITRVALVASNRFNQATEAETGLAAAHEALKEDPANEAFRLEAEAAQSAASRKRVEAEITRVARSKAPWQPRKRLANLAAQALLLPGPNAAWDALTRVRVSVTALPRYLSTHSPRC
jgi:hypothetical protein